MMIGDETVGTLVVPLDRTAQRLGGEQHADILGEDLALHAERAADIIGQHAHLIGRGAENPGRAAFHAEDALAADGQRIFAGAGIVLPDRRARLHRVDDDAVADEGQFADMRRFGESIGHRRRIAIMIIDRDIARHAIVNLGAPCASAAAAVGAAGSGSISTSTASAASFACAAVSATMKATASPLKRTLSPARTGRTGASHGLPSRPCTIMPHLIGPTPAAARSAAV